jgi:REP element-mobilizing transposase RayT
MKRNKLDYQHFYRRNLPHLQPESALIFVTYRLAFDLPKEVLSNLLEIRKLYDSKLVKVNEMEKNKLKKICNKYLFELEDDYLDRSRSTPLWLQNDDVAQVVMNSLRFNDGKLYELHLAMIMPNHVYMLIKPLNDSNKPVSLAKIMKDHKSYTANEANKLLQRNGQFWHHENYDHYIRSDEEYCRIREYILNNPVKAGLVDHYRNWKKLILADEINFE